MALLAFMKNTQGCLGYLIYEKQLKPVMYDIGDLWAQGKIVIATEHEISN